jgi:sodium pump decarboxylase gamma subunit
MLQFLNLAKQAAGEAAAQTSEAIPEVPTWQVVVLGLLIVFCVLIAIIIICKIMGAIMTAGKGKQAESAAAPAPAPAAAPAPANEIPNRGEFVAAVSAAIAEELGTDVSAIRIHSIKKL